MINFHLPLSVFLYCFTQRFVSLNFDTFFLLLQLCVKIVSNRIYVYAIFPRRDQSLSVLNNWFLRFQRRLNIGCKLTVNKDIFFFNYTCTTFLSINKGNHLLYDLIQLQVGHFLISFHLSLVFQLLILFLMHLPFKNFNQLIINELLLIVLNRLTIFDIESEWYCVD